MSQPVKRFTLIEMLVVVAIIGILASLLMPSLRAAINTANQVSCANNQRLILAGNSMYLSDNNGYSTTAIPFGGAAVTWYVGISHYNENKLRIWKCPATENRVTPAWNLDKSWTNTTEASHIFKRYTGTGINGWAFLGRDNANSRAIIPNVSQIKNPSRLVFSLDTRTGFEVLDAYSSAILDTNGNAYVVPTNSVAPVEVAVGVKSAYIRHDNFINLGFFDNHVEAMDVGSFLLVTSSAANAQKYFSIQ